MSQLDHLKKASETELRRFYAAECTKRFADISRFFIRNIISTTIGEHWVKAGIGGQADVWGYLFRKPYPMEFEIELKNVNTPDRDDQIKWRAYCDGHGIPYLYLRAKKDETPKQIIDTWATMTGMWLEGLKLR